MAWIGRSRRRNTLYINETTFVPHGQHILGLLSRDSMTPMREVLGSRAVFDAVAGHSSRVRKGVRQDLRCLIPPCRS